MTIIELMVAVAIIALLAVLAVPSFSEWIANSKVRSTAEEVANGLRMAQSEALRKSLPVAFVITASTPAANATPATTGGNWYVQELPLTGSGSTTSTMLQSSNYGSRNSVSVTASAAVVCFGSMGNQITVASASTLWSGAASCSPNSQTYNVTLSNATRSLRVALTAGGQIRLCDPSKTLGTTNPDGC
ncbi:GspH/FimT family pseudopilin [Curvibacter sp. CHRR-16]|uniref:pilus assembly FimT family protein n=1 Tax=Curvibacter sp. CHRR-16 TaxID=2835872 RepID=UPI001BD9AF1F|nr:GspH/FimT family pseudopilin [Curvibacter sp. CHRR-16]MBT0571733.1 GspH/FimT family pseudopilin [Curvibacter sp. CHRR-16]